MEWEDKLYLGRNVSYGQTARNKWLPPLASYFLSPYPFFNAKPKRHRPTKPGLIFQHKETPIKAPLRFSRSLALCHIVVVFEVGFVVHLTHENGALRR